VDGSPTDAVGLAFLGYFGVGFDLVASGINYGANLGDDVTYSGTVSAAMEGTLLGVPSLAISLIGRVDFHFEHAARFARHLASWVLERGLPADTLLNVNVPTVQNGIPPRGFALTRMGRRRYGDAIVEKMDPRGKKYYWIGGGEPEWEHEPGTDFDAIDRGMVSVTPLHLDMTDYRAFDVLKPVEKLAYGTVPAHSDESK